MDEYLESVTAQQLKTFEHIRQLVKGIVPDVGEKISYGIPTFTYKGTYLLYWGAFKHHMSLFPASDAMLQAIPELEAFRKSKGTLQFSEDKPISDKLLKKIIQHRLDDINSK